MPPAFPVRPPLIAAALLAALLTACGNDSAVKTAPTQLAAEETFAPNSVAFMSDVHF